MMSFPQPADIAGKPSCPVFEEVNCAIAVICVAVVIAVGKMRREFPEVAGRNRFLAHQADRLSAGCPAID